MASKTLFHARVALSSNGSGRSIGRISYSAGDKTADRSEALSLNLSHALTVHSK